MREKAKRVLSRKSQTTVFLQLGCYKKFHKM